MRVLVIGAGPMGIAAAIGAADRGHDVTVVERGEVGASLRTWGPARFFSPLHMNVSSRMRDLLGEDMPDGQALLTGPEYADRVLLPLTQRPPLTGRVRTGHRVLAIGRRGLTRTDYAGHPLRAEKPFRVLCSIEGAGGRAQGAGVEGAGGRAQGAGDFASASDSAPAPCALRPAPCDEVTFEAEAVLDASGGLTVPLPFGVGGLPASGESRLAQPPMRTLGELAERLPSLRGKRILLLGDGHSAANAIGMLEQLAQEEPSTRVIWAMRAANRRPCDEVANDPLPERSAVVDRANALAEAPPPFLRVERKAMIESLAQNNGHVVIALTGGRIVEADAIAAFTGYKPDGAFLSELAVEISPVTEGGARLYRAISNVTDCLSVPQVAPADLATGEERFYFVGSRGYGRSRNFLLQTGLAQLEVVLDALA